MNKLVLIVIGGVLGFMLGAGVEYDRGNGNGSAYYQIGLAYGCGSVHAMHEAVRKMDGALGQVTKQLEETKWCAQYREIWEKM